MFLFVSVGLNLSCPFSNRFCQSPSVSACLHHSLSLFAYLYSWASVYIFVCLSACRRCACLFACLFVRLSLPVSISRATFPSRVSVSLCLFLFIPAVLRCLRNATCLEKQVYVNRTQNWSWLVPRLVYTFICIYIYMYKYIHVCIHMYTHIYTYVFI